MPLIFLWEVLGGLGLFILGMKSMSDGLQKIAGERLRRSIEKITGNRLTAALTGSCLASILQSSSAASILVIGFVNAGLISMYQALGVMLGTGLGATIAVQFIAFQVSLVALPAIFLGVVLTFFSKKRRVVYLGNLLLGAGLIFLGLQIMESGFSPISENDLLKGLQNKYLSWHISAALLGGFLTFIIQSGSAVTGIVIAMAGTGLITYETGVAMVVGEILGTSLVAVTATINGTLAAKRTAFLYFIINLIAVSGMLLLFPLFLKMVAFFSPGEAEHAITGFTSTIGPGPAGATRPFIARHLANAHTIFNVINVVLFLPLIGFLARTAPAILPGREGQVDTEPRPKFIDVRVINTPTIAMLQAKNELKRMAEVSNLMFKETVEQFYRFDAKRAVAIQQKKDVLHILQHELSFFLILLSRQSGRTQNLAGIPLMLHMINDLKHMGDQNHMIMELLRRKKEERIIFSGTAMAELKTLAVKVGESVNRSIQAVGEEAEGNLVAVQSERDEIIGMLEHMLNSHMVRLTGGKCTVAAGMLYSDILNAFGKIAEYSVSLMEMEGELHNAVTSGSD